ncbi:hypothetical protein NIES4074_47010 [Cylindrospermum sp. NIES-4074]|nr:hypothetical protein NIES4074_47010 [Cylindrospermum sp. NIES-4074]
MKISELPKLGIALSVSFVLFNNLKAQAATIHYETNFAPFLPTNFNPGDTFDLSFRIHDINRPKPIRITRIYYHVVTSLLSADRVTLRDIFIPLSFDTLSSQSSSNFTSGLVSTPSDGADLTLVGLGGFAITNNFIPFNLGIQRSDIAAANLSFDLETDGLVNGDGFVASLNLNGTSLGSRAFEPVPEPTSTLSLLALGTLGAASTLKRKLKPFKSTVRELEKIS